MKNNQISSQIDKPERQGFRFGDRVVGCQVLGVDPRPHNIRKVHRSGLFPVDTEGMQQSRLLQRECDVIMFVMMS